MIPKKLRISGFLSYHDPVELDFSSFELACISGANGAGKSSLLDAMTWVLFGQARKRDDSIINSHPDVKAAEVTFTFLYEGQTYRVIRILPRGKTSQLEFQILHQDDSANVEIWRPLTEHTLKETQAKIVQVLKLDYDTFINAAFFLQGKADLFSQLPAGKRKEILGDILGLEIWEKFRETTIEQRKVSDREVTSIEGQVQVIEAELAEEPDRKKRLESLEQQLKEITFSRKTHEVLLEKIRQLDQTIRHQRLLVNSLRDGVQRLTRSHAELTARLDEKSGELAGFEKLLGESSKIEESFNQWTSNRQLLDEMEKLAEEYRILEKKKSELNEKIGLERAKLQQEKLSLETLHHKAKEQESNLPVLQKDLQTIQARLDDIEGKLATKVSIDQDLTSARESRAKLQAENDRLKTEMKEMDERKMDLIASEGATCPLCGQELDPGEKQTIIDQIEVEGKQKADQFRENKKQIDENASQIDQKEKELRSLGELEKQKMEHVSLFARKTETLTTVQQTVKDWTEYGSDKFSQLKHILDSGNLLPDTQAGISQIDREMSLLAYDAEKHAALKQAELNGRNSQEQFRELAQARSAVQPLGNEIQNLKKQISEILQEQESVDQDFSTASKALEAAEKSVPDLEGAEKQLVDLQDRQNQLNQEVGAAEQEVNVLKDLKARKKKLGKSKDELLSRISKLKSLERAFSKDGVPAMLIEQALPEIESHANELLDRLSDGTMSVRFETQSAYKDKKREDLRETLDILISDGAGVRDYELYSGGEAFRINFAIRLALSRVLAHRKGARLQTLIIDEGFGSQDANGRQKLIEAINTVRPDFEKILVITHLDELKDAFQTRIEVTKNLSGSTIQVV